MCAPLATESNRQHLQGYLAHKKPPPPYYYLRALGIVLLQGPREWRFLMSDVPLYTTLQRSLTHSRVVRSAAFSTPAPTFLPSLEKSFPFPAGVQYLTYKKTHTPRTLP